MVAGVYTQSTHLVVRIPCEFMRLKHQHVHERCLAMVQVAHDSDVANELGECHHVEQEPALALSGYKHSCPESANAPLVEARLRHVLLLHRPFPHFHGSNDGFCQRCRILLLDQCLDFLSIHLGRGGIILLVLVQYHGIMHGLCVTQ